MRAPREGEEKGGREGMASAHKLDLLLLGVLAASFSGLIGRTSRPAAFS